MPTSKWLKGMLFNPSSKIKRASMLSSMMRSSWREFPKKLLINDDTLQTFLSSQFFLAVKRLFSFLFKVRIICSVMIKIC